jgi:hypothetical protein
MIRTISLFFVVALAAFSQFTYCITDTAPIDTTKFAQDPNTGQHVAVSSCADGNSEMNLTLSGSSPSAEIILGHRCYYGGSGNVPFYYKVAVYRWPS